MNEGQASGGGIRGRGEEALSDLAEALLDNPLFSQAVTKAVGAGERAAQAQRSAMGALNIPSASDVERIEQRLRSLSNRLEALEDRLDDALDELAVLRRRPAEPLPGASASDPRVSLSESAEE
jgi:chromosome segregation ATPase